MGQLVEFHVGLGRVSFTVLHTDDMFSKPQALQQSNIFEFVRRLRLQNQIAQGLTGGFWGLQGLLLGNVPGLLYGFMP